MRSGNRLQMFRKFLSLLISASLIASPMAASAQKAAERAACAPTLELSLQEHEGLTMFRAKLSHLQSHFRTDSFEPKLNQIVRLNWPRPNVIEVSPYFMEKVLNLVDQARLKNAIANTVGLEHPDWQRYESVLLQVSLMGKTAQSLSQPIEKVTLRLIKDIGALKKPNAGISETDFNQAKARAITRVADMYSYIMRWRVLNGEMMDERALASGKTVAIAAVALVGTSVLLGTLVGASPIVAGAGAAAAGLSADVGTSLLLMKLAEIAAGAGIGFFGAPAAVLVQDSYRTYSEAVKQSANRQTRLSCELSHDIAIWKDKANSRLVTAAALGVGLGIGGGALTLSSRAAKLVLIATGLGVGIAQLYTLGKMSHETLEAIAHYRLAELAERQGDRPMALRYLYLARDHAQEAGDSGIEAVVIATLTFYLTQRFREALAIGSGAIRQVYAASADTLPTAGQAAASMQTAIKSMGTADNAGACAPEDINCVIAAGVSTGVAQ